MFKVNIYFQSGHCSPAVIFSTLQTALENKYLRIMKDFSSNERQIPVFPPKNIKHSSKQQNINKNNIIRCYFCEIKGYKFECDQL